MAAFEDPRESGFDPELVKTALMSREQFSSKPRKLILGIDMGIVDIGVCLMDELNHEIVLMATHLFDCPWVKKTKTSLASSRRQARSQRRNIARRMSRKKHIRKILAAHGVIPEGTTAEWFSVRKGDQDNIQLRVKGLSEILSNRELARVLYSFASHRGYIDHGKADNDKDAGKVKKALKDNAEIMEANGYETFAQYLITQPRIRNRQDDYSHCVDLEMVVDEVRTIFRHQRELGNDSATESLEGEYLAALRWLTDTTLRDRIIYSKVGYCTYLGEPIKRAPKSSISSEMVRAYQTLANVKIEHIGASATRIMPDVRNEIIHDLFKVSKNPKPLKWSQLRKKLGLTDTDTFAGVRQSDEKKDVCVIIPAWNALCSTLHDLNPALLDRLHENIDLADAVCAAATFASSSESFTTRIIELTDEFTAKDIESLLELPYGSKLFTGYGSTSLKALQMLRDAFEDTNIERLYDAEVATGLYDARKTLAAKRNVADDGLLKPYSKYSPICTNPVVLRSASQLRRVVNSIIRHYGLPDTIRVEVAKDLKRTEHEQKIIDYGNKFNKREKEKAADDIVEFLGLPNADHVRGRDLQKVRLYNEQGGKDPYTGQGIDFGRMLAEKDYVEVDHILPYSRSCDNSRTNKILCLTKSNRDKGNRTPYEWMTSGEPTAPNWDEFCIRMDVWAKGKEPKHYYSSKLAKLKEDTFTNNIDAFISRNLNDTRYMSKDVAKWLTDCLPFPEDGRNHVFCVSGAATALMRGIWRIGILDEDCKKNREDDRHHAVDAAVIAACTPSIVRGIALISEEHATHRDSDRLLNRSLPYPEFKDQVKAWIPCIVPTYSPTRTATGALFEANTYSYKGVDEKGKDLIKKKKGALGPCSTVWKDGKIAKAYDKQYGLFAVYDESTSRWLLDPLYYIDVQKRKNEKPFIRKFSKDLSIDYWEKIPLTGCERTLFIKSGDVLIQNGNVGRYFSYLISTNSVYMYNTSGKIPFQKTGPLANEKFPTLTKWTSDLKIMQEDCLGLCWLEFLTDRANNC
ncbi:type II CRISPR RNA-guided endonuclease Cas9 [Collinsella aerofaciens]|uniref:type II CRISPR RNA-guided endonuclease Cas9 n=1 Tax=Collinsella aerofaciens TaxID=74426 RepID=UPI003D7A0A16